MQSHTTSETTESKKRIIHYGRLNLKWNTYIHIHALIHIHTYIYTYHLLPSMAWGVISEEVAEKS